ncbi:MAG TPA: hypothetical protein VGA13_01240 [Acidimicrobiales bacterium]
MNGGAPGPPEAHAGHSGDAATPRPSRAELWAWVADAIRPVLGWVFAGIGGFVLLFGWVGVSREVLVAKQLPYLVSGGFGGVALVFFGAKLLDTSDFRRHDERLDRLERAIDDLCALLVVARDESGVSNGSGSARASTFAATSSDVITVVVSESGQSFHQPECGLVRDRATVSTMTLEEAVDRDLRPCQVCRPRVAERAR